jgi:hypothetical protein
MYQDAPTAIEAFLDKSICGGEVLQQVFILHVVNLDKKVLIWADQLSIHWKTMHGEDMRYVCFLELQFAPQGVDSGKAISIGAPQANRKWRGGNTPADVELQLTWNFIEQGHVIFVSCRK